MALSASAALQGGYKTKLLHGSDIPEKLDGVIVKVLKIRPAPQTFRSPYILDFTEPLPYGCSSWGLNMTNTAILAEKVGDDLEAVNGKRVYLKKFRVENPQTGETVWSLNIERVEGERKTPAKAAKAKPDKGKQPRSAEGIRDADVPF
jgi:hypothetical protein